MLKILKYYKKGQKENILVYKDSIFWINNIHNNELKYLCKSMIKDIVNLVMMQTCIK